MAAERMQGVQRWSVAGLVLSLWLVLAWAVLALPADAPGLGPAVERQLGASGVPHPVTAVLLNFRSYDTLLEIAVLLLVMAAVRSLGADPENWRPAEPSPVLAALVRVMVPVAVLVAGYLLWAGAYAPGGAFQAGAVLGAASVLLLVTGSVPVPSGESLHGRLLPALGLATFLTVAAACVLAGGSLLEYPRGWATPLIVLIETVLALSIGVTLALLYAAGLGGCAGAGKWK